jgi:hypothetical protein
MGFKESYSEKFFDNLDNQIIVKIKKKDKRTILIFLLIIFACCLIIPITPSRNGDIMIEDMSYLNAMLIVMTLFMVLFGFPLFIFMFRKRNDIANGKKVVIESMIKKLKHDKKDIKLKLTNPNCDSKWIFVHRDKFYSGIAENDAIMISYLPKTKFVLELKRIE